MCRLWPWQKFTTLFSLEKGDKIELEQPHRLNSGMVLMTTTDQSVSACLPALREHYSKKCTIFAHGIERLVREAGHRPVVSLWGNIQIQLLFSRPSGEDRLTGSLASETLIQCYSPLRCILKQIWSIWITKTRVTPGRVLSTVHSVPEMNSKQKEILKKDFTGYNGRNISKIMLH